MRKSLLKAAGDRALATIYVNLEPNHYGLRLVLKPRQLSGESGGGHG